MHVERMHRLGGAALAEVVDGGTGSPRGRCARSRSKPTSQRLVPDSSLGSGWRWMPCASWITRTNGSAAVGVAEDPAQCAVVDAAVAERHMRGDQHAAHRLHRGHRERDVGQPRLLHHLGGVTVPGGRVRAHRPAAVGVMRRAARLRAGRRRAHLGVDHHASARRRPRRRGPAAAAPGSRRWRRIHPSPAATASRMRARSISGSAYTAPSEQLRPRMGASVPALVVSGVAQAEVGGEVDDQRVPPGAARRSPPRSRRAAARVNTASHDGQLLASDEAQRGASAQHGVGVVHVPAAQAFAGGGHHVDVAGGRRAAAAAHRRCTRRHRRRRRAGALIAAPPRRGAAPLCRGAARRRRSTRAGCGRGCCRPARTPPRRSATPATRTLRSHVPGLAGVARTSARGGDGARQPAGHGVAARHAHRLALGVHLDAGAVRQGVADGAKDGIDGGPHRQAHLQGRERDLVVVAGAGVRAR